MRRSEKITGYIVFFIVVVTLIHIWLKDIAPNLQNGFVGGGNLWSGYNLTEDAETFINEHQEFFLLLFVIFIIFFFTFLIYIIYDANKEKNQKIYK